jgi:thiamine biosynthesis lipoprotein ApbE
VGIGVRDDAADSSGAEHRVWLAHAALSGSGLAVRGAHLVDPHTASPAARRERIWSHAPTAAWADALSTAFFVMDDASVARDSAPPDRIGAILVAADGSLRVHGVLPPFVESSAPLATFSPVSTLS